MSAVWRHADTYVEFEGHTAYGDRSRIESHVTSADWQESDRVFAGVLTAFGSRTGVISIGGYGTFDGVMVNNVRRPRIEGVFRGERIRAFDVVWGSDHGSCRDRKRLCGCSASVAVLSGDSAIHVDGRFSLGFPRRDGGEEINARIRVIRRPSPICAMHSSWTSTTLTVCSPGSSMSSAHTAGHTAWSDGNC